MALTIGVFKKQTDGGFTGVLKGLNAAPVIKIMPVAKPSDNAPSHRVFIGNGQRFDIGAGWTQVGKTSGEPYLNLKIASPELGPTWVRARLVKLETLAEDGFTHAALWEPRDP